MKITHNDRVILQDNGQEYTVIALPDDDSVTLANKKGTVITLPVGRVRHVPDRRYALRQAEEYVSGARNESYGTATQNFQRIANLWTDYRDNGEEFTPADVANMMILLKVSRLNESPDHLDSWIDVAGYAALGAEVTQ